MADDTPVPLNRIERILAFMIAGIAGVCVLAIIAIVIASFADVDTSEGLWLPLAVLPAFGLPIALLLIIVFAIVSITRRRRIARDGGQ